MFDAQTLAQLRRTQEASMMHECDIEPYIVGDDGSISYGQPVHSICGFMYETRSQNAVNDLYEIIQANGELRLPLDVVIGMRDRVTITKSFGRALDPAPRFEVCELPDSFGPSGHVVKLKEIYS